MSTTQSTFSPEYEAIIIRLDAQDSDERRRAVYDLENYEANMIIDLLVKSVQDENRAVREAASEILVTLPATVCTHKLAPLLGSDRIEVRNVVAAVLVKYGESAVQDLIPTLVHENEDVRKFSADILGLARNTDAVEELCQAVLNDSVATVVESSIEALGKIGDANALPTLYEIFNKHSGYDLVAVEAIGLIGEPSSIEFLTKNLKADDPMLVFAIIDALGNVGSVDALGPMVQMLPEAPDFLKTQTLITILKIGQSSNTLVLAEKYADLLDMVIHELKDAESVITPLFIHQLGLSPSANTIKVLFEHATDLPASILVSMLKACEGQSEFLPQICALVNHPDDWVSYTAIEALGDSDTKIVQETVLDVLQNGQGIRLLAAMKMAADIRLTEATGHLEALSQNDDEDIRNNADMILKSFLQSQ